MKKERYATLLEAPQEALPREGMHPFPEPGPPSAAPLGAGAALAALGVYLGGQVLGTGVVATVYSAVWRVRGGDPDDAGAVAQLMRQMEGPVSLAGVAVGGLVVMALVARRVRLPGGAAVREQVGLSAGTARALAAGLGLGVVLAVLYNLAVGQLLPPEPDRTLGPVTRMASDPGPSRWLWTAAVLLLSPPVEELVFRGVLQAGFARAWGWWPAAALTTALFVGMHYLEFRTYLPAAGALLALSLLALAVRRRSGALGPAVAVHLGYNLGIVLLVNAALRLQG